MSTPPPRLTLVPPPEPGDDAIERLSQDLVAVAQHQDRDAFARLFEHFAPRVKSYMLRIGCSAGQAEDLAQDALVAVWRKAHLFDPDRAAASTWVFTIARHLRIDALRRRQGDAAGDEAADFDHLETEEPGPEARTEASLQQRRLAQALSQLPPEQVQVLHLSYYEDCPHARIAQRLNLPLGTVKSRMRLAVAQLRRLLET